MKYKGYAKGALGLLATALLSACATKSVVKADGTTDEPVFPKPYSVTFNQDRGTFPTADELANVKAGMTKDELYKLLGRPHYDEGMFGVREWDYLFHFHTPGRGTDGVTTCQFKVLYDKDKFTRSFFWKAVDPQDAVCPPEPASPKYRLKRVVLGADVLFAFDKSGLGDIRKTGKEKLDKFAEELKRFERVHSIRVIGHTDRLGERGYNSGLSARRAETVRRYLVSKGVPAGVMSARGLGERQPVKQCGKHLSHAELVSCLQPNRRVEIEVDGLGELTVE